MSAAASMSLKRNEAGPFDAGNHAEDADAADAADGVPGGYGVHGQTACAPARGEEGGEVSGDWKFQPPDKLLKQQGWQLAEASFCE